LLAPLLFAAGASSGSMADVVRWVDTKATKEVREILMDLNVDEALNAFTASCNRPTETGGSVHATAETILDVYTDPQVAACAASCEITPAKLLDRNGTLYLVAPAHAQDRLRPLFEALVMSVVREAQDRAQAGRTVVPGLLLMLDEAGNTAPLRDLPSIASTGREQGIQTVSVWQDLAQVQDRYGRQATTVVNNHRGKLALAGIADLGTLDYFSRLLGDTDVDRTSVTQQAGGGHSTSTSTQQQRLAPADMLRQLPLGKAVLVYGSTPPTRLTLRRADRGALAARHSRPLQSPEKPALRPDPWVMGRRSGRGVWAGDRRGRASPTR
jgi:type IV secretion system protein VirD4